MAMNSVLLIFILIIIGSKCAASRQPHIITIIADDMGFHDVSFRGSDLLPTPNIDALAYSGIILNRHYVLPTCTPSRSAFMTGLHPLRFGRQGYPLKTGGSGGVPVEIKLLPQYLKELGYSTHLVGKWHLGLQSPAYLPQNRGFDSFLGYYNGYMDYYHFNSNGTESYTDFVGFDLHDEEKHRWDLLGQYATDVFSKAAVDVIMNHDPERPLYLQVAHLACHTGTEENDGLQTGPGVDSDQEFPHVQPHLRRKYNSIMKSLDDSVGEVFNALSKKGLLENSIVLFFSDNGAQTVSADLFPNYGSNWPLRGVKFTLYEGGIRGAAVLWSPLLNYTGISNNIIHITDWLPTFVAAAGGIAAGLDGRNKWNDFNETDTYPEDLLLNIDERQKSEAVLLQGKWKVVKQNCRDWANYDKHYELQLHSAEVGEVSPDLIKRSTVGKILNKLKLLPKDSKIRRLREDTREKCTPTILYPAGMVNSSTDFFCKEFCVFDIIVDPCENHPLNRTDIVMKGLVVLDRYRKQLVPQQKIEMDGRSDPKKHGGAWAPWLPDEGYQYQFNVLLLLYLLAFSVLYKQQSSISTYFFTFILLYLLSYVVQNFIDYEINCYNINFILGLNRLGS